jgi:hypothetical protein
MVQGRAALLSSTGYGSPAKREDAWARRIAGGAAILAGARPKPARKNDDAETMAGTASVNVTAARFQN